METGVTDVSDVTINPDETVVQPPDELIAKEVSAIVNFDSSKDKASKTKPSNSGISSTSTSRVHIQETRNKRFTPAQQQRQEIYKNMVALFEAENKKEDKEEDEIDMAFSACAVRMRIHLNKDQIEDVIQEVEGVVRRAINNVQKGMPALTPSPVPFMQPGANVIQSQISGFPMQQPQQQQQQQHNQQQQMGTQGQTPRGNESGDFFRPYEESRTYSYTHM